MNRGGMAISRGALRELSSLVAENAELRGEKVPVLASLCPPSDLLKQSSSGSNTSGARITGRHLNGILAVAQYLAQSDGGQHREQLFAIVLEFLKSVPSLPRNTFWPTSFSSEAAKEYFPQLLGYVCRIASVDSGASLEVSSTISEIIQRVSAGGLGGVEGVLVGSSGAKAFFSELGRNCPFLHLQDSEKVILCLVEHWIRTPVSSIQLARGNSEAATSSSSPGTSGAKSASSPVGVKSFQSTASGSSGRRVSLKNGRDSNDMQAEGGPTEPGGGVGVGGKLKSPIVSPGSGSTISTSPDFSPFATPVEMSGELTLAHNNNNNNNNNNNRADSSSVPNRKGKGIEDDAVFEQFNDSASKAGSSHSGGGGGAPGFRVHKAKFESETVSSLERQEIAFLLLARILEKPDAGCTSESLHIQQLRTIGLRQLRTFLPLLKIRRRDWPTDVAEFKVKLIKMIQVSQAAAVLQIKCLRWLEADTAQLKGALQEGLPLLLDTADACNSSPWRMSKPCEDLFDDLISGISYVAARHQYHLQRVLLRFKTLVLSACGQASAWGTSLGPVFESMIKGICIVVEAGWKSDKGAVESFLLSLAAHVREKDTDKASRRFQVTVQMNVISFLADLSSSLGKLEVVELILPLFVESLEEGDASDPSLVRLKLLEAVGRLACLGSEKSYREVVVHLTRSYLDKLSMVGSTYSRTVAPEATTERLETLPAAFLQVAQGLGQANLRVDYRRRLLALCSDVGLIAEEKNGRAGADLMGPLLPALAEVCVDVDPTQEVESYVLKLYRNLWFYITIFGLAPPLMTKGQLSMSKSGSQGGILSHLSSGLSQAISGGGGGGGVPSLGMNSSGLSNGSIPLRVRSGPYAWNPQWALAVEQISQGTPPLVVGSLKWVEDELELSALNNNRDANEKEVAGKRASLSAALGARVDTSSISGVGATYLLAIAFLEVLRYKSSGGLVRCISVEGNSVSALSLAFKYLDTPSLSPAIHQCLVAVVHQAFNAAMLWLAARRTSTGEDAEQRDAVMVAHACFLIRTCVHRGEHVREVADTLLTQLKTAFPQVLWNPDCLNAVLSLVSDAPIPMQTPDVGTVSVRSISHHKVHEWISQAILIVPCTMQGLLQEQLRRLSRWPTSTSELLSVLSLLRVEMAKPSENTGSTSTGTGTGMGMASIPAVTAAAAAAAGVDPHVTQSGSMEVLSTGIISANIKSNCSGEIAGMKRLYVGIGGLTLNNASASQMQTFGGMSLRRRMSFNDSKEKNVPNSPAVADHGREKDLGLNEMLTSRFVQQLQEYVIAAEKGTLTDPTAFREACLRSAALVLSDMSASKDVPEGSSHLLRLLCWCPAHIFTPEAMKTGLFVWTWILSAAPQLVSRVLAELVDAWLWTVDTKKGLFASGIENSGPGAKLRPQLTHGAPSPLPYPDPVLGIDAHRIWLGFFLDRYEAIRHGSSDQLLLLSRFLQGSICRPTQFSSHPAAAGSFFTLLLFGLKFSSLQGHLSPYFGKGGEYLLEDSVYRAGLSRFAVASGWYDSNEPGRAHAEAASVSIFLQQLSVERKEKDSSSVKELLKKRSSDNGFMSSNAPSAKVEGSIVLKVSHDFAGLQRRKQLLVMLCQSEVERLETWANPLKEGLPRWRVAGDRWGDYVKTAWETDPRIAVALVARFPGASVLRTEISTFVQKNVEDLYDIPEALPYIITPKAVEEDSSVLQKLPYWAPCSITRALDFLTPPYKGHHRVLAYVLRVLESYPPERVTFFMPQLVQSLRYDQAGLVEGYLMVAAQRSTLFAHILVWQLQGEEPPSSDDKVPEKEAAALAKSNLYDLVPRVKKRIIDSFSPEAYDLFIQEFAFFDQVTSISGALYPLPKDERRAGIRRELEKIKVEGDDLYLPTDPSKLVRGIKLDSGIPLQSAAKVPIMITFEVVEKDGDPQEITGQACIFKVGDDCRQDVLALQVIALLRDIFEAVSLNLYLFPYGVLPTGFGRGIIEVVRDSRSRNQMAEITDGGLFEIFQQEYGQVGSEKFERARDNFIVSSAGYAVASLLLQPKDRHNGNLLVDSAGRLVHIDFGFILETSPGGNIRFERAHFKLSHEMTQLLDPSGSMKSEQWQRFVSLCVKGYLAARDHMDGIVSSVLLMVDSGLPCFSRGDPIGNLRKRLHPEMTEREAANFMIKTCNDAYNKWSTAGYDLIQRLQQGIEM